MYIKVKRIMGIHAAYDTFGEATENISLEKLKLKERHHLHYLQHFQAVCLPAPKCQDWLGMGMADRAGIVFQQIWEGEGQKSLLRKFPFLRLNYVFKSTKNINFQTVPNPQKKVTEFI